VRSLKGMQIGAIEASSARSWKERTTAIVNSGLSPLVKREKILEACALREMMHVPRVYAEVFSEPKDNKMQVTAFDPAGRKLSAYLTKPCERVGDGRVRYTLERVDCGYNLRRRLTKVSYITHLMSESPGLTPRVLRLCNRFFALSMRNVTFFKKVYLACIRALRIQTRIQFRRAKLYLGRPLLSKEKNSSGFRPEVQPVTIRYRPLGNKR